MAKFCVNCGNELSAKDKVCGSCGTPVDEATEEATPVVNNTTVVTTAAPKQSNGLATAGFIVSLVSSLLCCGTFNLISLILSIIGLVKAKDLGGAGKGMAVAGIIISAIFMVINLIFTIIGFSAGMWENLFYSYGY